MRTTRQYGDIREVFDGGVWVLCVIPASDNRAGIRSEFREAEVLKYRAAVYKLMIATLSNCYVRCAI